MTYELAKGLKDAGFPQNLDGNRNMAGGPMMFGVGLPDRQRCYVPTLSELIAACGDLKLIVQKPNMMATNGKYDCYGSTPEEVVARLWLALNSKRA